ncbi:hypothetical protein ABT124_48945 [Streptomyces sp. NPDC001982]|uniref:hypothetical protein n=1 Tax=Streptomyces sp. NPDC001982 TaxID=3154405 RepID=UPI00332AA8B3
MSVLPQINPGEAATLLAELKKSIGSVPNMAKAMANSPALLKGWMSLSGALAGGVLPGPVRERLALATLERARARQCGPQATCPLATAAPGDEPTPLLSAS